MASVVYVSNNVSTQEKNVGQMVGYWFNSCLNCSTQRDCMGMVRVKCCQRLFSGRLSDFWGTGQEFRLLWLVLIGCLISKCQFGLVQILRPSYRVRLHVALKKLVGKRSRVATDHSCKWAIIILIVLRKSKILLCVFHLLCLGTCLLESVIPNILLNDPIIYQPEKGTILQRCLFTTGKAQFQIPTLSWSLLSDIGQLLNILTQHT